MSRRYQAGSSRRAHAAAVAVGLSLWAALSGCSSPQSSESGIPQRIVSLSPSITETLFALGLGSRVIGVTTFCLYPPEAKLIEKIGDYADANLEKIIALRPDLVILSAEHEKQQVYLHRFGVSTLSVGNTTCAEICTSFAAIGRRCGAEKASDSLIALFRSRMSIASGGLSARPRVLICVGRDSPGAGRITSVFAAGARTFYYDLIDAAGGVNAFPDSTPAFPRLSAEGVYAIAPDIVIDVAPAMGAYSCAALVADWQSMKRVPAVARGAVYCVPDSYATVPGPRLFLLLDDLRHMIADYVHSREGAG
jgi:iron complex transport system substrate-binding protein